jgi:hypothetical protein
MKDKSEQIIAQQKAEWKLLRNKEKELCKKGFTLFFSSRMLVSLEPDIRIDYEDIWRNGKKHYKIRYRYVNNAPVCESMSSFDDEIEDTYYRENYNT